MSEAPGTTHLHEDPPGVPTLSREDYIAALDRCYPPELAKVFKGTPTPSPVAQEAQDSDSTAASPDDYRGADAD